MIEIEAVIGKEDGILRVCKAEGHAKAGKAGSDIVCAAVSVLMRTAYVTLSNRKGIKVLYSAPEPGQMLLKADYEAEGKDFLLAAGTFLLEGINTVAREFPENCKFSICAED